MDNNSGSSNSGNSISSSNNSGSSDSGSSNSGSSNSGSSNSGSSTSGSSNSGSSNNDRSSSGRSSNCCTSDQLNDRVTDNDYDDQFVRHRHFKEFVRYLPREELEWYTAAIREEEQRRVDDPSADESVCRGISFRDAMKLDVHARLIRTQKNIAQKCRASSRLQQYNEQKESETHTSANEKARQAHARNERAESRDNHRQLIDDQDHQSRKRRHPDAAADVDVPEYSLTDDKSSDGSDDDADSQFADESPPHSTRASSVHCQTSAGVSSAAHMVATAAAQPLTGTATAAHVLPDDQQLRSRKRLCRRANSLAAVGGQEPQHHAHLGCGADIEEGTVMRPTLTTDDASADTDGTDTVEAVASSQHSKGASRASSRRVRCDCGRECFTRTDLESLLRSGPDPDRQIDTLELDFDADASTTTPKFLRSTIGKCETGSLRMRCIKGKAFLCLKRTAKSKGCGWRAYLKQHELPCFNVAHDSLRWYELCTSYPRLEQLACGWSSLRDHLKYLVELKKTSDDLLSAWTA